MKARWRPEELTYCGNVHACDDVSALLSNITNYFGEIRKRRKLDWMNAGLWLSSNIANEFINNDSQLAELKHYLCKNHIVWKTANAFPFGKFHKEKIKSTVYSPGWDSELRLDYTIKIATLMAKCAPADQNHLSISTLPLGYGPDWNSGREQHAIRHLLEAVQALVKLEADIGKCVSINLEMEPDCAIEFTEQLVSFFEKLQIAARLQGIHASDVRRHIGACFDICHQSVQFEDIQNSLKTIADADIQIGKIQVSCALDIPKFEEDSMASILAEFADSPYLHQTRIKQSDEIHSYPDLVDALSSKENLPAGNWRVHFHTPIHSTTLLREGIKSTQRAIVDTLQFLSESEIKPDIEVETYTWNVLPDDLRPTNPESLVQSLLKEITWLEQQMHSFNLLDNTDA